MKAKLLFLLISITIAVIGCKSNEPTNPNDGENGNNQFIAEAIDLGLPSGIKWANANIGAATLYDFGYYFQWGCVDKAESESWDSYCHGNKNHLTKYCTNSAYGSVDNRTTLQLIDDAAHGNWGDNWRMPTKEEAQELWNKCTRIWETHDNISGYKFIGPNGNSIFLPSNGWIDDNGNSHSLNIDGLYWTSSLYEPNNNGAWGLITRKTTGNAGVLYGTENRNFARAIRAVCSIKDSGENTEGGDNNGDNGDNGDNSGNNNGDNSGDNGGGTPPTEEWVAVSASGYLPYWYCPTDRTTVPSVPQSTSDISAYRNTLTGAYKVKWAYEEYAAHKGYNKLKIDQESHTTYNSITDRWGVCTDYCYFEFTIY
ncbi:MAG: DUF1566 domain-containing protein [Paludibacteraceae bacterium]|nr:DUF1566 domain-containing protein [Paludibacteraceae bacterium]